MWWLVAALVACSDDAMPSPSDATPSQSRAAQIGEPEVVRPPLVECPARTFRRERDGVVTCELFPNGRPDACPEGQAHFPGEAGCQPIGTACPDGEFPEVDGTGYSRVSYVSADPVGAGGDGSRERPYAGLLDASTQLRRGDLVVLGKGRFTGTSYFGAASELTITGACVTGTIIDRSPNAVMLGDGSSISNLTIDGALTSCLLVGAYGHARIHDAILRDCVDTGIRVADGGELRAERVVLLSPVRNPETPVAAIVAEVGGEIALDRVVIEGASVNAILAAEQGQIRMTDVALLDTTTTHETYTSAAIAASDGAWVIGRRVLVDGAVEAGVQTWNGADVTLQDAIVRHVDPHPIHGRLGVGALARDRSAIRLERVRVEDVSTTGIAITGRSRGYLEDIAIDGVALGADSAARALTATSASTLHARRISIRDAVEASVLVDDLASAQIEDLAIEGTTTHREQGAVYVQGGARLDARRVRVAGGARVGVAVLEAGSSAIVRDLRIDEVFGEPDSGAAGRGVVVQDEGARLELLRARIDGAHEAGVYVRLGELHAEHLRVLRTERQACATTTCSTTPGGHGIVASGAPLHLAHFLVEGSAACGLLLDDVTLDLAYGIVRDNPLGACVQDEAIDLAPLEQGVLFGNNGASLDSTRLPVPEPMPGL